MVIEGDDQAQAALRFCLFHLLANAPHADQVSVSARGLQGQDYWGSIFWDCDIYVLPFFTSTQPDYARRSLLYRYHTLDGARRKAQGLGFRGAYYAWQSQETGDETCALYVFDDPRTGQKIRSYFADEQIHISADVVYALWQYVQAAGDWAFMADYGLEIACEVARFFVSRASYDADQDAYDLRTVLGPDEYHERVDNNAYTNALARFSINVALSALVTIHNRYPMAYEQVRTRIALSDGEIAVWRTVADRLYVPLPDPATGLIPQFDGYFDLEDALPDAVRPRLAHPDLHPGGPLGPYQTTQSIKQADVILLLYLLRDQYSTAVKEANWHYYEPRTAHDFEPQPDGLCAGRGGRRHDGLGIPLFSAHRDDRSARHRAALEPGRAYGGVGRRVADRGQRLLPDRSARGRRVSAAPGRDCPLTGSASASISAGRGTPCICRATARTRPSRPTAARFRSCILAGRPKFCRGTLSRSARTKLMSSKPVIPTDGMIITQDTRLAPGVYVLPNGITLDADNITLEGERRADRQPGAHRRSDPRQRAARRDDPGVSISGYHHGIRADHCHDLTIENVRVRDTAEIEGIDTFLYLWTPLDKAYGAAILCHDVHGGAIRGCDLQHQMDGILLYGSSGLTHRKQQRLV